MKGAQALDRESREIAYPIVAVLLEPATKVLSEIWLGFLVSMLNSHACAPFLGLFEYEFRGNDRLAPSSVSSTDADDVVDQPIAESIDQVATAVHSAPYGATVARKVQFHR